MSDQNLDTAPLPETNGPGSWDSLSDRLIWELRRCRERGVSPGTTVEEVLRKEGLNPTESDPDVLMDLVYAEWVIRIEHGESPTEDEYRTRFPMISQRLERQWDFERGLVELSRKTISVDELPPTTVPPPSEEVAIPKSFVHDFIGKYKLICVLGSGGQADVYRAHHPELQRDVVIKIVRTTWQPDTSTLNPLVPNALVQQVFAEGRILGLLSHPNIARVYDIGLDAGRPFVVMEFVQGSSLDQYYKSQSLDMKQIARLLALIARAVAAAHARGILHRDIKPQNIVVQSDGVPMLIDFGLAKIADIWHPDDNLPGVSGTIGFMPPEQAMGDPASVGVAADVFGLGAVLYYLLTGRSPYHGSSTLTGVNIQGILERVRQCDWDREALKSPQIPVQLAAICTRAMAADPKARFTTANEFAYALEAFAVWPRVRLRTAASLAALLVLVIILWNWRSGRSREHGAPIEISRDTVHSVAQPLRANLQIRVRRDGTSIELPNAVPVATDEQLIVEATIPAGVSAILFVINSKGKLQQVAAAPRHSSDRSWRYPEDLAASAPLTGTAGTECILLIGCGTTTSVDEIEAAWKFAGGWPNLPNGTILKLSGTDVTREQVDRDLGTPQKLGILPADEVAQSLKMFAGKLATRYSLIEGFAFRHIDPSD